jgi:hypothetical protein
LKPLAMSWNTTSRYSGWMPSFMVLVLVGRRAHGPAGRSGNDFRALTFPNMVSPAL